MAKRIRSLQTILFAVFLFSLPITNFPFFPPSFGGNEAFVKPFLVFPLLGLVVILTLPRLFTRNLPRPGLLLILFFSWSLISSLVPFFRLAASPWREINIFSREIRMIITLGLALAIYFTVSLYPDEWKDLKRSLGWLYAGLALVLFWGTLQIIYVLDLIPGWYQTMGKVQQFITSQKLNPHRVSGMTYEPSSFADQLLTIWLPWVYAALLTDFTAFNWRWKWVTVEKVLFVWTFGVLASTLSRTGLIMGVGIIACGLLLNFLRTQLESRASNHQSANSSPPAHSRKKSLDWKKVLSLALLASILFLGLFYLLGSGSGYISRMWDYWFSGTNKSISQYLIYIGFGSRITYWKSAFQIFENYPLFGVGLGNFTVYFPDNLPFQQLVKTPQLLRHLVPAVGRTRVITPKHFLARILAETGLVGGAIFAVFLLTLGAGALYLWLSDDEEKNFWGTGSLLGLAAFTGVTFSFDSFAIPNPWILFGLITAGFTVFLPHSSSAPPED